MSHPAGTFPRTLALLALMLPGMHWAAAEERGALVLHFIQLPVGKETYDITDETDGSKTLRASFEYTERGSRVPLSATLRMKPDFTPLRFESKGKSYRPFSVDAFVLVNPDGKTATVREGQTTRQVALPERFVALSGYNPLSVQMMMLRYWLKHGRPKHLTQLPAAGAESDIRIEESGHDTIPAIGKSIVLSRYSVSNVVWGRESIWLNDRSEIVAATSYAGGLPFEAIRSEYQDALPQLIHSANADRIKELSALSNAITPVSQGDFAIAGALLINGGNSEPLPDAAVLVHNGRIEAVGPRGKVTLPKGVQVIEARGATLLPGLWEMHAHFAQTDYGPAYLAAGVTTARDCGGEFEFVTAVRDLINDRGGLGPHLLLAGLVDRSGEGTFGTVWADTPEAGRAVVAKYKAANFQQMKIYSRIQPDVLTAIVSEAHRVGMTVTGHVPEGMTAMQAVAAGMDQINHFGPVLQAFRAGAPSRPIDMDSAGAQTIIRFFKEHHTVIDPTMAWGELLARPVNMDIASFEPGYAKAPYTLTSVIGTAGSAPAVGGRPLRMDPSAAVLLALYRAGIPIVAGTDKALPGHSLHRELELYVRAGLTPMEVIRLATGGSARVMGMDREVGTIEVGKRADMILTDGNPLLEFGALRKVSRVIVNGRMYDPAELWKSVGFRP
jgi:hypothetical protein